MEDDVELSLNASVPVENDVFPSVAPSAHEKADSEADLRRRLNDLLHVLDL
jgi:hypothetical protein